MSASMRQKRGRTRLRFCPNSVATLLPAHSRSSASLVTEKVISLSQVLTPSV